MERISCTEHVLLNQRRGTATGGGGKSYNGHNKDETKEMDRTHPERIPSENDH